MQRRGLRLEWMAGLAMAVAVLPVAYAQSVSTQTAMTVSSQDQNGRTQATAAVTVTGMDGSPAGGVVNIEDGSGNGSRILAEAALNGSGAASAVFSLPGGDHNLRAVYAGDATHETSASETTALSAAASSTPNFQVTVAPVAPSTLPLKLTAGQSGSLTVTVSPEDNAALTSPMFVTLSCSALPSLATCSFAPESVEILPTTPASCATGSAASACPPTSLLVVTTQGVKTSMATPPLGSGKGGSPTEWAFLLPGVLGLGGLAWGARRRRWLQRIALAALVGLVATLGTTACSPLWRYYNHGPTAAPATPAGTYNVLVTAQSSNGVTAITNSTTMVVTVN